MTIRMAVAGFVVVVATLGTGADASAQDPPCVPAGHAGVPICDPSDPPALESTSTDSDEQVLGTQVAGTQVAGTQVAGTQVSRNGLPVTGGDIAAMVGMGGAAVLVGLGLRSRARRMAGAPLAPTS